MHHLSTAFQNFNGIQIDNAEDLDVVMPMYNLLEYSKITKKQQVVLWNYYRDKPSAPLSSTTMVMILLEFLMFYQIFHSPHVKQSLIIRNKLVYTSCLTSC